MSNDLETYDSESFVGKWEKFWLFLPFVSDEGYQTRSRIRTRPKMTSHMPGVLCVDSMLYARRERWAHAWDLKPGVVRSKEIETVRETPK